MFRRRFGSQDVGYIGLELGRMESVRAKSLNVGASHTANCQILCRTTLDPRWWSEHCREDES